MGAPPSRCRRHGGGVISLRHPTCEGLLNLVRVGFWSPVLCRAGGTETWHSTLLPRLDAGRVHTTGMAVLSPEECDPVRQADIERTCPVFAGPGALRDLARHCDVIVTWGIGQPRTLLPEGRRPKLVHVSHGDAANVWNNSLATKVSGHVDGYVGVSRAAVGAIPAERRKDARVIHNAVDPARVQVKVDRATMRRRWGIPEGKRVVGTLMRLSPEKDPFALNRALGCLGDEWVGVAVGDGESMGDVVADAYCSLDTTRTRFPGATDDPGSALNAFDVLLFPSLTEGFGLAIAEAWLVGTPVVSTPVGIAVERAEGVVVVPRQSSGPILAWAVEEAAHGRHCTWAREIAATLSPARFGREWSDYLCEIAA